MKTKTSLCDFTFTFVGYGCYSVTYTSPVTGKQWRTVINSMPLIDLVKNSECPKQKDLDYLKYLCKNK